MVIKTDKDYRKDFTAVGQRLRQVRESTGLSRSKFAALLDDKFPETTLKNYELGYRQTGTEVIQLMEREPKLAPYVNFVLFGRSELPDQRIPVLVQE